ncbi:MAG: membrane protein insertion efficiency factor YidD [Alphaproteobacteria bacterium]|nr:membrane protein insertion efficiency factor YidD [Alphaproteobacteria bacterium]
MCSSERNLNLNGPAEWLAMGVLRTYQLLISPVFYAVGIRCRHEPSCSNYAMDAVRAQGAWRGFWLALGRFGRCRPGGTWGYDPAPTESTDKPWWAVWAFRSPHPRVEMKRLSTAQPADDKD